MVYNLDFKVIVCLICTQIALYKSEAQYLAITSSVVLFLFRRGIHR